jgi:plastocyanin
VLKSIVHVPGKKILSGFKWRKHKLIIAIFLLIFLFLAYLFKSLLMHQEREYIVEIHGNRFEPNFLIVNQGEKVVFRNADGAAHWPASNVHPTHGIYPEFDAKRGLTPNGDWVFRFDRAGIWRYHDHLNPILKGTISVKSNIQSKLRKTNFLEGLLFNIEERIRYGIGRLYYFYFPENLKKDLDQVPVVELTKNQNMQLRYWLKLAGPGNVMAYLRDYSIKDKELDCHIYAHSIGWESYNLFGNGAFNVLDHNCGSGYIHGVMESLLLDKGTEDLKKKIEDVCLKLDKYVLRGQCVHGIGHGLLVYEGYNLPLALDRCRNETDSQFHHYCYTGVFMENIINSEGFNLDHGSTNWVSDDPYFPCDMVSQTDSIQNACYLYQASRMLDIYKDDFSKVWQHCLSLKDRKQFYCLHNLGQEAAYRTRMDPVKTVEICMVHPETSQPCIKGAVALISHYWEDLVTEQPQQICRNLKEDGLRKYCYEEVGELFGQIFDKNIEKINTACGYSEESYRAVCEESGRKVLLRI